jgi:3-hydroxy-9,10-secoandrosta-1,3,5(10)-triene-9,17-dione monooxygenase
VGRGGRTADDPVARLVCAEVAAALDEMKTILRRNFGNLAAYAERGELPPIALRLEYKFHSALVAERCSVLAARLFKATGGAGIYADQPFGRMLADIHAARQHISNQFEMIGRNWGAVLLGGEPGTDLML